MRSHRAIRVGPIGGRFGRINPTLGLLLAWLMSGPTDVRADTFRVKTSRGTFLVASDDPGVAVRADGEDLVVTRAGGDEFRLKLDSIRADASAKEPVFSIRRDGKEILTARRISNAPEPAVAGGPGRAILDMKPPSSCWSLAMTPDGRTLVSGHQGFIRVWDPSTLVERYNIPINRNGRRVAITPDGATIASAEFTYVEGKAVGNLVIRDGKTGATRRQMKPVEAIHGVAIDPTGKVAVSSSWAESGLRVWEVDSGEQVGTLKGHTGVIMTIAFSPDGKTLASAGDDTVRLWDVDTGEVRRILRGHHGMVESVAFSADGKILASGGFDDDARIWDVETGKLLATFEFENPVLTVALSPDGKTLATASARWGDGFYGRAPAQVRTWDVGTARPLAILPEHPAQVFAMLFKPDGKTLITASLSGAVTLWNLATFQVPDDVSNPKRPANR